MKDDIRDAEPETVNDAMAQGLVNQLDGKIPPALVKELCKGEYLEQARAVDRQAELNREGSARGVDGLGQLHMRIDKTLYMMAMRDPQNQAEYGKNPWLNPKFVKKMAAKYPQLRVKYRRRSAVRLFDGLAERGIR